MTISSIVYQEFYNEVVGYLVTKHFKPDQQKKVVTDTPLFWTTNEFNEKKKRQLYEIAFGENSNRSSRYLYDKKSDYNIEKSTRGLVDDDIIVNCLTLLGYEIPKDVINKDFAKNIAVQAKVLYQFFVKDKMHTFYKEHEAELKVYDHDTKRVIESAFIKKRRKIKAVEGNKEVKLDLDFTDDELLEVIARKKFTQIIKQYFECLNNHDYKGAYEFWHPDVREKYWNNELSEFIRRHYNLKSIKFYNGFTLDANSGSYRYYYIEYEQVIKSYFSAALGAILLYNENLEEFTKLSKIIKLFLEHAERQHFYLSNFSLKSFYDYTIIEHMHYLAANDQEKIKAILPQQTTIDLTRYARIEFQKYTDEKLYIKEFTVKATSSVYWDTSSLKS